MAAKQANSEISGLESHLGYWLRQVSNVVSGAFARRLQAERTSEAECVVLRELHERGQATPGELAEVLTLTRGAVSKIVDKLESKGWLAADTKVDDNRVRLLSPSRKGHGSLVKLAAIADSNVSRFFDCLNSSERATLRALLAKVAHHHDLPPGFLPFITGDSLHC